MAPEQILHYKIERTLGKGAMGEVVLATDTHLDRKVALKFVSPDLVDDEQSKKRLLREAKAACRVEHSNVVAVHAVESHAGRDFIVMEYVEGKRLSQAMQESELTRDDVLRISIKIAEGLQAAHEHGVIHRDIKPDNIILTPQGQVKIADFGLARWPGATPISDSEQTIGTFAYMSPEQARHAIVDTRSDIFSLGVLLYELLCRHRPFQGDHPLALAYSLLNENPQPLRRYCRDVPERLQLIIQRALAKDPDDRYQAARELAADLQRARSEVLEATPPDPRPKRKRRLIKIASFSTVLALLLTIVSVRLLQSCGGEAKASENRLVVLYFENLSGTVDTEHLGVVATNLLITELAESPSLTVTSTQRLYDLLKQVGRADEKQVTRDIATDVAIRASADWMLLGTIVQVQPRLILTTQLVAVETGEVLATQRVESPHSDSIIVAIDRLAQEIRTDLAIPGLADAPLKRTLTDVTTANARAYTHYARGIDHYYQLHWEEALSEFDAAIALDSGFALPYAHAAIAAYSTGRWQRGHNYFSLIQEDLQAGHLPARDSLLIAAIALRSLELNVTDAVAILDNMQRRFPEDKEAYYWQGLILHQNREGLRAVAALSRALELDPDYPFALFTLTAAYESLGDIPNAIRTAERYRMVRPDEATPRLWLGELYMRDGRLAHARSELGAARALDPSFYMGARLLARYHARMGELDSLWLVMEPFLSDTIAPVDRATALNDWGEALFLQGRFDRSYVQFEQAAVLAREHAGPHACQDGLRSLALRYLVAGDFVAADTLLPHVMELDPQRAVVVGSLPMRLDLYRGDFAQAREWRDSILAIAGERLDSTGLERKRLELDVEIAMGERDFAAALNMIHRVRDLSGDPVSMSLWAGRAYLETGRPDRARDELSLSIALYHPFHDLSYWNFAWYYLARTHEALDNRGDAADAYRKFLFYWGDADRSLPEVEDAKQRLAALEHGPT